MELSILFARGIGIYLVVIALSLLVNQERYRKMTREIKAVPLVQMLGAVLSLFVGLVIVLTNNVWSSWELLITLFGWLALAKGALNLIMPDLMVDVAEKFNTANYYNIAGFSSLIIGAFLAYIGFLL